MGIKRSVIVIDSSDVPSEIDIPEIEIEAEEVSVRPNLVLSDPIHSMSREELTEAPDLV